MSDRGNSPRGSPARGGDSPARDRDEPMAPPAARDRSVSRSRSPVRRRSPSRSPVRARSRSRSRDRGGRSDRDRDYDRGRDRDSGRGRGRSRSRSRSRDRGRGRGGSPPRGHLFVAGIPFRCNDRDLRYKFEKYGYVTEARVVMGRAGESKGFGFVTFEKEADAEDAIYYLDKRDWDGRRLLVEKAKSARH